MILKKFFLHYECKAEKKNMKDSIFQAFWDQMFLFSPVKKNKQMVVEWRSQTPDLKPLMKVFCMEDWSTMSAWCRQEWVQNYA